MLLPTLIASVVRKKEFKVDPETQLREVTIIFYIS